MSDKKHIGIRIDKKLNQKFRFACEYYGEFASEILRGRLKEYIAQGDCGEYVPEHLTNVSICMTELELDKLRAVAKNDGMTITGVASNLMKSYIREFEKQVGEITEEDLRNL